MACHTPRGRTATSDRRDRRAPVAAAAARATPEDARAQARARLRPQASPLARPTRAPPARTTPLVRAAAAAAACLVRAAARACIPQAQSRRPCAQPCRCFRPRCREHRPQSHAHPRPRSRCFGHFPRAGGQVLPFLPRSALWRQLQTPRRFVLASRASSAFVQMGARGRAAGGAPPSAR
eukprot:145309-Pleurochrysis_carterae.AAC.1